MIFRIADEVSFPPVRGNADYEIYLGWLARGNTPLPYEPPAPVVRVPEEVTMGQARLALLDIGKLQAVEAVLAGMPEPERTRAKIEWDYRPTVRRDSQLVAQLGAAIGLTRRELDDIFTHAAGL
ncbi:hypothetical protein CQB05_02680 [Paracidovorax citrulli]|nr:hypothetical protein CQB05_02680 [Paracidovorax citrulli]